MDNLEKESKPWTNPQGPAQRPAPKVVVGPWPWRVRVCAGVGMLFCGLVIGGEWGKPSTDGYYGKAQNQKQRIQRYLFQKM